MTGAGDIGTLPPGGDNDIVRDSLGGVLVGMIAIVVLGVVFMTSEYARGVIRTTFTASPRRGRVLAAKAVVLGVAVFAVGLVAALAALLLTRPIQRRNGFEAPAYPDPSLADGAVLRAVIGTALFLAVLALFALGVGTRPTPCRRRDNPRHRARGGAVDPRGVPAADRRAVAEPGHAARGAGDPADQGQVRQRDRPVGRVRRAVRVGGGRARPRLLAAPPAGRVSRRGRWRAVHMEWTKLRTVRSTAWLVLAHGRPHGGDRRPGGLVGWRERLPDVRPVAPARTRRDSPSSGVYLGQIAVVVLAALAVTTEYGADTMRVTLAAYPRRGIVFAAKATVVMALVLGAGALGVLGSLAAGRIALPGRRFVGDNAVPPLSLADGPTLRAAIGTVLYLGLIALLSLGVAMIVRHTAAALSSVLAMLFLPPMIAPLLTNERWQEWVLKVSPMTAGLAIQATKGLDALPIGPWPGLGVLAAYAGVACLLGAALFTIRDA